MSAASRTSEIAAGSVLPASRTQQRDEFGAALFEQVGGVLEDLRARLAAGRRSQSGCAATAFASARSTVGGVGLLLRADACAAVGGIRHVAACSPASVAPGTSGVARQLPRAFATASASARSSLSLPKFTPMEFFRCSP